MTEDILNKEQLRNFDLKSLEFEYRPEPRPKEENRADAIRFSLLFVILSGLFGILVRFLGPSLFGIQGIALGATLGFTAGLVALFRYRATLQTSALAAGGIFLLPLTLGALFYVTENAQARLVAVVLSVLALLWAADRMFLHSAYYMLASPWLSRKARLDAKAMIADRHIPVVGVFRSLARRKKSLREAASDIQKLATTGSVDPAVADVAGIASVAAYPVLLVFAALLVVGLPLVSAILSSVFPGFQNTWGVAADAYIALFAVLAPCVWLLLRWRRLSVGLASMVSFLTYGISGTEAPGTFQSPAGSFKKRLLTLGLAVALVAASILPALRGFSFLTLPQGTAGQREQFERSLANPMSMTVIMAKTSPSFQSALQSTTDSRDAIFEQYVGQVPFGWIWLAYDSAVAGDPLMLIRFILAVFLCLVFPPFALFAVFALASSGPLAAIDQAVREAEAECREAGESEWTRYVRKLTESKTPSESEHLWIGPHFAEDYPVLLHEKVIQEHAYIVGESGSGKTALGITSILTQLVRRGSSAIVVIDLKGDNALFQTLKHEAEAQGREFKWFTNELGSSTYCFNPFIDTNVESVSVNQVCELMLEALNLNHGEGYGRSYFSRVARQWLGHTLRLHPDVKSFEELHELAEAPGAFPGGNEQKRDVFELISVIESLATFEQLNVTPVRDRYSEEQLNGAIHFPEVIREKQIVYFWLPAAVEAATVREMAKLAVYSLLVSSYRHQRNSGEIAQTYLVVDEFQRIASENFKLILEQARSMGVSAILANQTVADLQTPSADLRSTVQSNTRLKLTFSATDLDQQEALMTASGEKIAYRYSWSRSRSESGSSTTVTASEVIVPRIERNDAIRISDAVNGAVFHVSRGSGLTAFSGFSIPVRMGHTVSLHTYRELSSRGWPESNPRTLVKVRPAYDHEAFVDSAERLRAARLVTDDSPIEQGQVRPGESDWSEALRRLGETHFTKNSSFDGDK